MATTDDPKKHKEEEIAGQASKKNEPENTSLKKGVDDETGTTDEELETEIKIHQAQTERD